MFPAQVAGLTSQLCYLVPRNYETLSLLYPRAANNRGVSTNAGIGDYKPTGSKA